MNVIWTVNSFHLGISHSLKAMNLDDWQDLISKKPGPDGEWEGEQPNLSELLNLRLPVSDSHGYRHPEHQKLVIAHTNCIVDIKHQAWHGCIEDSQQRQCNCRRDQRAVELRAQATADPGPHTNAHSVATPSDILLLLYLCYIII